MTALALALIMLSSILHATWNFLAKRAEGGLAFTWLFGTLSVFIYSPLAIYLILNNTQQIGFIGILFVTGSSVLHLAYYGFLQKGYKLGDMSLVYPLSRGTSPLLTTLVATSFLGEQMEPLALVGVVLIVLSTFALSRSGSKQSKNARASIMYGLLTATVIASYTLWDRHAVSVLLIPPLLYDWGCNIGRTLALTPYAVRHADAVRRYWHTVRREALGIAILSPLAYILVLTAMSFTPVSYVASAREMSILFGTLMGGRFLQESGMRQRIASAGVMIVGIILLTLN